MNHTVQADARFLRRVFLTLVLLTIAALGMVGLTTAQAMTDESVQTTSAQ